jgi:hypothetical protein
MGEIGENGIGEVEIGLERLFSDDKGIPGDRIDNVNVPRYADEIKLFASTVDDPVFPDDFTLSDTITSTQDNFTPTFIPEQDVVTYNFTVEHRLGYTFTLTKSKYIPKRNSSILNPNLPDAELIDII